MGSAITGPWIPKLAASMAAFERCRGDVAIGEFVRRGIGNVVQQCAMGGGGTVEPLEGCTT